MSSSTSTFDGLSRDQSDRIDQVCVRFEEAWKTPQRLPSLERFLDELTPDLQRVGFRQLFRIERDQRQQRGEIPAVSDYRERFPEHVAAMGELLSPVSRLEEEPDHEQGENGGRFPEIPGYRIIREVGRGGMGVVYEAVQLLLGPEKVLRTVALKTIDPSLVNSDNRKRLLVEIETLAKIRHPQIVQLLDFGCTEQLVYFTMDWMPAGNLRDWMAGRPQPWRDATRLMLDVVRAVAFLHTQEPAIIHLDLKPANILLNQQQQPLLADFGVARLLPADEGSYETRRVGCTAQYAAPEQFLGRVSKSCDVYGLGATLYEMITGRPPFNAPTTMEIIAQVRDREPLKPRSLNPNVDRDLEFVCLKCLEKEPKHRYRSAHDLAADLSDILQGRRPVRPGWKEWLLRQVHFRAPFEHPALWSKITLATGVYTVLGHLMFWLLLQMNPTSWACWFWFLAFHIAGLGMLASRLWDRWALEPWERSVVVNWCAAVVADGLLFALFCPPFGEPPEPLHVCRVYPAWMAIHGLMWVMQAPIIWGRFYLLGLGFFLIAAVMPYFPWFAPLTCGLVNGASMAFLSKELRTLAHSREDET